MALNVVRRILKEGKKGREATEKAKELERVLREKVSVKLAACTNEPQTGLRGVTPLPGF